MARNSLTPFGFSGFDPITSLHREMNRLFDDAFRGGGARGMSQDQGAMSSLITANMNVSETEAEVRIAVELPGVTEQDIELTISDDMLTIRGEKKIQSERGGAKENYHHVECSYGTFQRSLRLPFAVNPDDVRAAFLNGILTVTLPKTAQQERSRRIPIETSATQQQGSRQQSASPSPPAAQHGSGSGTQTAAH